uniref:Protein BUD31 n=1 Tax=Lygus hesperus TaxID=30085 RepID=A0A0A9WBP5_LYGHE
MREAEAEEEQYKTRAQVLWPILQIHHQRSRYIYDMYYSKKAISRDVYEYCLDKRIADANLISKWKKSGYENLCCLRCIQQDTSFNTTCICRVPKKDLSDDRQEFECLNCGCPGCSS